MFTIITALVAEHKDFCVAFNRIDQALPRLKTLALVKTLAHRLESRLLRHAASEDDLVLFAVQRTPKLKRRCVRFHKEHQEIDVRLAQIAQASRMAEARVLMRGALDASRRHFEHEERVVFPLLEQAMEPQMLGKLGTLWKLRHKNKAAEDWFAGVL
jgi:hemerythrin-like domain-containing protein